MDIIERYDIERKEEWLEWLQKMPWIKFPADWEVKMSPPFGGALARFRVKLPSRNEKSIYFDPYEKLGIFGEPYWEVYPYRGCVGRCALKEIDKLLEMIADEGGAENAEN